MSVSPGLLATPTQALIAVRAAVGAFLLYYLNTRPVLEFFERDTKEGALNYGWGRILYGLWTIMRVAQPYFPQMPGRSRGFATPPPTITSAVAILIGMFVFAWGLRAGIVPRRVSGSSCASAGSV